MFLDHTQRRSTVGSTPLDEWSARRRNLYLTTHDTHNRQISMPPVGFEPKISAGERSAAAYLLRSCRITMVADWLFLPHQFSFLCSSSPLAFNFSNILLLTTDIIFLHFYILLLPKSVQIVTADNFAPLSCYSGSFTSCSLKTRRIGCPATRVTNYQQHWQQAIRGNFSSTSRHKLEISHCSFYTRLFNLIFVIYSYLIL